MIHLKLWYSNFLYDSASWSNGLPDFKWVTIEPERIIDNTTGNIDRVVYSSDSVLFSETKKWSCNISDSQIVGTKYFYIETVETQSYSDTCYFGQSGIGLNYFRISLPDSIFENNHLDNFLDTASTYLNVPYVWGNTPLYSHLYDYNNILYYVDKTKREGYYGIDCSGLVNWTLLKNGNPLQFSGVDSVIVGSKNSHAIWRQAYSLGFTAVSWGAGLMGWCIFGIRMEMQ